MQTVTVNESSEGNIVRTRGVSSDMFSVKFTVNDALRQNEMKMHAHVSGADCVLLLHQYGTSSADVIFGLNEPIASNLRSRIEKTGIADDAEFWKLASQLARAIASVHEKGVLHLAVEVRTPHLAINSK